MSRGPPRANGGGVCVGAGGAWPIVRRPLGGGGDARRGPLLWVGPDFLLWTEGVRWSLNTPPDALEGKGPQRRYQRRVGRRLEEVAKAVGGRLLSVTNAVEAGTWRQGDSGWA